MRRNIGDIMRMAPVIPVLSVADVAHARQIAEALVAGGLSVLEVTLRTPAAFDVIGEMRKVPGALVGAGTVCNPTDLAAAIHAGAEFIVAPGLTDALGQAAVKSTIPFLPGVANAGDIMRGMDLGLRHFKFFPAEAIGGIKALKALCGPFGQVHFCPTGGVTQASAADWLAIDQVLCVGGSWLVGQGAPDVAAIGAAARAAKELAHA